MIRTTVSTPYPPAGTRTRVTAPSEIGMMLRLPAMRPLALERIRIAVRAGGTLQKAAVTLELSFRGLQRLIAADEEVRKIVDEERSESSAQNSSNVRARYDGEKPKKTRRKP